MERERKKRVIRQKRVSHLPTGNTNNKPEFLNVDGHKADEKNIVMMVLLMTACATLSLFIPLFIAISINSPTPAY